MRVKVLQARAPLGHLRVGAIIEAMPANQARGLIARGIVAEVVETIGSQAGKGRAYTTREMRANRT